MIPSSAATHMLIRDVPDGGCVLFGIYDEVRIGFLVKGSQNLRFILDPEAVTQAGDGYPALYGIHNFPDEHCLYFKKAVIAPELSPGSVNKGYHSSGRLTKALYLSGEALVMQAAQSQHIDRFNLVDGTQFRGDIGSAFHALSWEVKCPALDNKHQTLMRFVA